MKRTALCHLSAFLSVSLHVPCLLEDVRLIMKSAKSRTGKKRKREKKTHSQFPGFKLSLLRQLLPLRAGNKTSPKKSRTHLISEYYATIMQPTFLKKKTLLTRFQIQIKVIKQEHPTLIFGKYLFGRRFEI